MSSTPSILCVFGSPRRDGNTDLLLNAFAAGATSAGGLVVTLHARDLEVQPCTGCNACGISGKCVLRDGMASVYAALDAADAIAIASPVYFLGLPSQLKRLIDRCQPYWSRRYLLEQVPEKVRPGALLSSAGSPAHSVFTCAQRCIEAWFDVLGARCVANMFFENVDEKAQIQSHPTALEEARGLGASMVKRVTESVHQ